MNNLTSNTSKLLPRKTIIITFVVVVVVVPCLFLFRGEVLPWIVIHFIVCFAVFQVAPLLHGVPQ